MMASPRDNPTLARHAEPGEIDDVGGGRFAVPRRAGDRFSDETRDIHADLSVSVPAKTSVGGASTKTLDRIFKALASEARRELLDALRERPHTTGELVMLMPALSRFAVMQHLKVLHRAGLLVVRKRGRTRHNFLNPVPLQLMYERWVSRYEGLWAGALTQLARDAERPATPPPNSTTQQKAVRKEPHHD